MAHRNEIPVEVEHQICEWRERGRTLRWISKQLASRGFTLSTGAIEWRCLVSGSDLPHGRRRQSSHVPGATYMRNGRLVRYYTAEEDALLLKLAGERRSLTQIGSALGRSKTSVRGRLVILARLSARCEDQALITNS